MDRDVLVVRDAAGMVTFNAIDVETAKADQASFCQIGIAQVRGGKVVDRWRALVNSAD